MLGYGGGCVHAEGESWRSARKRWDGMGWDLGGFKALDEVKERKEGGWMDGWMGWYVSYTGGGVAIYASQVRGRGRELGQT